jgi:hypothetical protein
MHKRPQIAIVILSKKSITRGIRIPDFKLYHRAIVTKPAWSWHINRHTEQWNRIEDPEINRHSYSCLIHMYQKYIWRKDSSLTNGVKKTEYAHVEDLKLYPSLLPSTKINSKWIKDLNVRPETLKLLQENREKNFQILA